MPKASIVIVTRNRRDKAKNAIESALAQTGDNEILVLDDASTDGTTDFLRGLFPQIRILRFEKHEGLIVQRSRAAELAVGDIVFSIDDDAAFANPDVVADTLKIFTDPLIGAVSIPSENCYPDGRRFIMSPPAPDDGPIYVIKAFTGTAYAVRRDIFLKLGGFQNYLFQWGEETDFCQRLYDAGYVVRRAAKLGIYHYPEWSGKYSNRVRHYVYRNRLLIAWFNAPAIYLLPLIADSWLVAIKDLLKRQNGPIPIFWGMFAGMVGMLSAWRLRKPIAFDRFRLWMLIRKKQLMTLPEIAPYISTKENEKVPIGA